MVRFELAVVDRRPEAQHPHLFSREYLLMETDDNKNEETPTGSKPQNEEGGNEAVSVLGSRSLRKLRDRVERAAHELRVLREENSLLQERVTELESVSAENIPEGNAFFLESDPESVKRKVEGFIHAIDRYLDDGD